MIAADDHRGGQAGGTSGIEPKRRLVPFQPLVPNEQK